MQDPTFIDNTEKENQDRELIHKMDRTRKIILEKELLEMRAEMERTFRFERDYLFQNLTEREIKFEKALALSKQEIESLKERVDSLQNEVDALRQQKIDIQQLSLVLSDLSLRLSNLPESKEE